MLLPSWLKVYQPSRRRPVGKRGRRTRLVLELLEDRLAPAVYRVVDTADNTNPVDTNHTGKKDDPFLAPSLRSAVIAANSLGGPGNEIDLAAASYQLSIADGASDDNSAASGDLDVTSNLTLVGNGASVDGGNLDRVFQIFGSGTVVVISDLNISNGMVSTTGSAPARGGDILNAGQLALTNVSLSGNVAGTLAQGGAIYNAAGAKLTADSTATWYGTATGSNGANGDAGVNGSVGADGSPATDGKPGGSAQGGVIYNENTGVVSLKTITLQGTANGGNGGNGGQGGSGGDGLAGGKGGNAGRNGNGGKGGNAEGGALYSAGGTVTLENVLGSGFARAGLGGSGGNYGYYGPNGSNGGNGGNGTAPGMAGGAGGTGAAGGDGGDGGRAAGGFGYSADGSLTITNTQADIGHLTGQALGGQAGSGGESGYGGYGGYGAAGLTPISGPGGTGAKGGDGGNAFDGGSGGAGGAADGGFFNVDAGMFSITHYSLLGAYTTGIGAQGGAGGTGSIANSAGSGGYGGSGGSAAADPYGTDSGGAGAPGGRGGNGGHAGNGGNGGTAVGGGIRLASGTTNATITACTITATAQGGPAGGVYYGGAGGAGGGGGSGGAAVSSVPAPQTPPPASGGAGSNGAPGGNAGGGANGGAGGSGVGGAIYSAATTLTLDRTTIQDSLAIGLAGIGGGLAGPAGSGGPGGEGNYGAGGGRTGGGGSGAAGGNAAPHGNGGAAGAGLGGALYVTGGGTIRNSTLANNRATGDIGGAAGVHSDSFPTRGEPGDGGPAGGGDPPGSAGAKGSTAGAATAGADSLGQGGGIYFAGSTLTVLNDTIVGNQAKTVDASKNAGGGVFVSSGAVQPQNTIIAGNTSLAAPNGSSAFASQGHNFIGDNYGSTGFSPGATNGDLVGTLSAPIDPLLGPLADNGGPTLTMKPLPDSPVINAGDNNGVTATDQTGAKRIRGVTVDIGAIEIQANARWVPMGPAPINNGQTPGGFAVSGRVTAVAADPDNSTIVYIATAGGGVWKTTNANDAQPKWDPLLESNAVEWNGAQPMLFTGAIAIARDPSAPNDDSKRILYVGMGEANNNADRHAGSGILMSPDSGRTWTLERGGDNPKGGKMFDRSAFSKIAVDPNLDPTKPSAVYAAMAEGSNNGVWRSLDGGTTWASLTNGVRGGTVNVYSDLAIRPNPGASANILYMAIGQNGGSPTNGVWYTKNANAADPTTVSWTASPGFPVGFDPNPAPKGTGDANIGRITLALAPSAPGTLYASIAGNDSKLYKLFKTTNGGGATGSSSPWTEIKSLPNYLGTQGFYDTSLAVDPSNADTVYAFGAYGRLAMLRINKAGLPAQGGLPGQQIWFISGVDEKQGPHDDHHGIAFDAAGRLLDANDGGIARLANPAAAIRETSWTNLTGNLQITTFVGIALHPTDSGIAVGGSQDNGTEKLENGTWTRIGPSDGGPLRFDPNLPNILYRNNGWGQVSAINNAENFNGLFQRSDDGGATWTTVSSGISAKDNTGGYPPFVIDPSQTDRLYLATDQVYVTTKRGSAGWKALPLTGWTDPLTMWPFDKPGKNRIRPRVDALAISGDGKALYAAAGGYIYYSQDRGQTWKVSDFRTDSIARIVVDAKNPLIAYAVRDRFNGTDTATQKFTGHIFQTIDGGNTWSDLDFTAGIPDVQATSVALVTGDAGAPDTLYVGTTTGLFSAPVNNWVFARDENGLPPVMISDLDYNRNLQILGAGTYGRGLWVLNLGTQNLPLGQAKAPSGPQVFFAATDPTHGRELWRTDGTEGGTVLVKDINPKGDANPELLTRVGNRVFFVADNGKDGRRLWVSNGTEAGTQLVPGAPTARISAMLGTDSGDVLYFVSGSELWRTDGTAGGTRVLMKGNVYSPFRAGATVYFGGTTKANGTELWTTDGVDATAAHTHLVKDINPRGSSSPFFFAEFKGMLFFTADDGVHGRQIWKTDGASTTLVTAGVPTSFQPKDLTSSGSALYFTAFTTELGRELWQTDGSTTVHPRAVADLNAGPHSSNPEGLTNVNGTLYFTADDGRFHGRQLWKTTGPANTSLVPPDGVTNRLDFVAVNNTLFYAATSSSQGQELFFANLQTTGLVKDINPGNLNGYVQGPTPPVGLNGKLIFSAIVAADGNGIELWISDGTERGTRRVKDISPGKGSSAPGGFVYVSL